MPLKTLIVDDTVTYRKVLSDIIHEIPEAELAGVAPSGAIALKKLSLEKIQLVLLDVNMPEMDGVETLKRIKKEFPDTAVVMVSGETTGSAKRTIEALELGAVDFIRKPESADTCGNYRQLKHNILGVVRLITLKLLTSGKAFHEAKNRKDESNPPQPDIQPLVREWRSDAQRLPTSFGVCVIGVSTGGPEALSKIISAFKEPFLVPLLCVQHMPSMFTKSLAESLAKKASFRVVEAVDNEDVRTGTMYIAPGGRHMVVRRKEDGVIIGLNDGPPENSCRPSVDVLFRSVADAYGDRGVLSIVLTGMGNDGCNGVRALKRRHCYSITQSEQSCVVYGMPRAVDEAGLSDVSLTLEAIPTEIERLLKINSG